MVSEELLSRCIAAVEAGENPIQVAARYPEYATELEPLLQAMAALRSAAKPSMSSSGFVAGRQAVAAEAARWAALLKAQQAGATATSPAGKTRILPVELGAASTLPAIDT